MRAGLATINQITELELQTITARAWGEEEGELHRRKGREKGDMETGGGSLQSSSNVEAEITGSRF